VIEVAKVTVTFPARPRIVLVVEIRDSPCWRDCIPLSEKWIKRHTDAAFDETAVSKVYWIGVIGPHWRYDVGDDEQDPESLTAWHETTHDQASYTDLQGLVALVAGM
jgi:hypothetical protein